MNSDEKNINKPNPIIYKNDYTPQPSGIYPRLVQHSKISLSITSTG